MSKKKRKGSQLKSQKITLAQSKNEFFKHLQWFCDKVTANSEIFKLIPAIDLEILWLSRYRPVRIMAAEGNKLPSVIQKYCQSNITSMLKFNKVPFVVGDLTEVSVYDYYSVLFTLGNYAKRLLQDNLPEKELLTKALAPITNKIDGSENQLPWDKFHETMHCVVLLFCRMNEFLYTAKSKTSVEVGNAGFLMEVYSIETEKAHIEVDGKNRPVYRVGWFNWQPQLRHDYPDVKSEDLGLMAGLKLKVYIQNHAMERLHERMDGMNEGCLSFGIFNSIKDLKVCRNKKGELLIEYHLFGNKTGYFRADVIEGQLLLTTFLFLTNNGTPEGERLHKNTGIMKEDKIYLAIDKISTFINSDIADTPHIKQIFIDAGCESLFNVGSWAYFGKTNENEQHLSELVSKYLSLEGGNKATDS